jgi:DNA-binding CsgD family transcriptional regulator
MNPLDQLTHPPRIPGRPREPGTSRVDRDERDFDDRAFDRLGRMRASSVRRTLPDSLPVPRPPATAPFTQEHREQVMSALAQARSVAPDAPCGPVITDWAGARRALALAWTAVTAQMRLPGSSQLVSMRIDALDVIRRAEQMPACDGPDECDSVTRLEAALGPLRRPMPTQELIRKAADAVTRLGFDRALVSSVHEGRWVPLWVSDPRDPAWAERILEAGRADQRTLGGRLAGSELGVSRSGVLVRATQRDHSPHDNLARTSRAASYVVVPLMAGAGIIGLLHADCYYQGREPDGSDRRLLRLFADVLAQIVLRSTTTDQLDLIESELGRLSETLPSITRDAPHPIMLRALPQANRGPRNPISIPSRYRLTKRQVEVIDLVAQGHTNAVIGAKLYITQDTVKSHVKLLLRKFNAGNRAELVSRWLSIVNQ